MILLSHTWGSQAGSREPKYVGSRNILYHAPDLALVTASLGLKAGRCLAQDPTAHCADFYLGPFHPIPSVPVCPYTEHRSWWTLFLFTAQR